MATVGSLVVNLMGNTQNFRKEFSAVPGMLRSVAASAMSLIGIGGGLAGLGRGISLAASAEQTSVAFETMLGSAEQAKSMLSDLRSYSDKSPFSFVGVADSARLLLNMGVASDQVMETMRMLGDIAAGDEQKLHGLSLAFGQSSSAGRLMGQDLNQMINAGFNPLQEISKRTGESMAELKSRMEAGGISTSEVTQAFRDATSEGGRFFGMTERMSGTLGGLYSTMRDTIDSALSQIGAKLVETFDLRGVVTSTTTILSDVSQWLIANAKDMILLTGAAVGFAGGMMAIRAATQAAATAAAIFRGIANPWSLIPGLFGAAIAVQAISDMFGESANNAMALNREAVAVQATVAKAANSASVPQTLFERELMVVKNLNAHMSAGRMNSFSNIDAGNGMLTTLKKSNADMRDASLSNIDEMFSFAEKASGATSEVNKLHAALQAVSGAADQLGQARVDRLSDSIERQIGLLSGATEKIQALRDEISGVDKITLDSAKLSQEGATNDQVREFAQLSEVAKRMKELRAVRDQVESLTATPMESFEKQLKALHELKQANLIDGELFNRGVNLAADDFTNQTNKQRNAKQEEPLSAVMKGSKEAQQSILRAMSRGATDPSKTQEELAKKNNKALDLANSYLKKIADVQSGGVAETVVDIKGV